MRPGRVAAGIVFALPVEADAFERRTTDRTEVRAPGLTFHEGTVAGRRVAWCVAGVGRGRAERAARLLVDGHAPALLVAAGFAGGLDPSLSRGGVVEPVAVRGEAGTGGTVWLPETGRTGPLLVTVDRIVSRPAEKAALAAATGAALVDMETLAVAEAARGLGLPCRAVRVVSDAAGEALPDDLGPVMEARSVFRRAGALVGMLGRRPRAAADLWRLWERAVVDARALAAGIEAIVASLPEARSA